MRNLANLRDSDLRALLRFGLRTLWREGNHRARLLFADSFAPRPDTLMWDADEIMRMEDATLIARVDSRDLCDAVDALRACFTETDALAALDDARDEDDAVDRAHEDDVRYGWNGKEG